MPATEQQIIRYYSTNRSDEPVTLRQALLRGQAIDRGLYLPQHIPAFEQREWPAMVDASYAEIAFAVLRRFAPGSVDEQELQALCQDAYDYDVPLERVTDRQHVMRLDRGPTASFKDFAARMMARLMGAFVREEGGELVILTATSGDTGSAVAHAFLGVPGIRVVVLFPIDEVSDRQRKQMTTLGGNVRTIGVDGKFDDCQALVKRAFADGALKDIRLTSANSINIGRLLPQSVYYIYAWLKLCGPGKPLLVAVPSGNFGNMMGAMIARKLGADIPRLIIATNANDEVPVFWRTGAYSKVEPSRVCISNAMNVGHPSNLARLVDMYGGWMDEVGTLREMPDIDSLRRDIHAVSISDDQTRATIKQAYEQRQLLLEPHGAVGWAALQQYLSDHPRERDTQAVCVETAHPAKFPEEIRRILGIEPEVPASLQGLDDRPETFENMHAAYGPFRELLLSDYRP